MTAFADWLIEQRKDRGMTQEELAHRLGVSFATVNRWENGKTRPQYAQMRKLEETLGGNRKRAIRKAKEHLYVLLMSKPNNKLSGPERAMFDALRLEKILQRFGSRRGL